MEVQTPPPPVLSYSTPLSGCILHCRSFTVQYPVPITSAITIDISLPCCFRMACHPERTCWWGTKNKHMLSKGVFKRFHLLPDIHLTNVKRMSDKSRTRVARSISTRSKSFFGEQRKNHTEVRQTFDPIQT